MCCCHRCGKVKHENLDLSTELIGPPLTWNFSGGILAMTCYCLRNLLFPLSCTVSLLNYLELSCDEFYFLSFTIFLRQFARFPDEMESRIPRSTSFPVPFLIGKGLIESTLGTRLIQDDVSIWISHINVHDVSLEIMTSFQRHAPSSRHVSNLTSKTYLYVQQLCILEISLP